MKKSFRGPYGPVYRKNDFVFTADDFDETQAAQSRGQPGGQGGGDGANTLNQDPEPPLEGEELEIEVVDSEGNVRGVIPPKGKKAEAAPQPQQPQNILEATLEGENVPQQFRGKKVSEVLSAMNALSNIQQQYAQHRPQQPQQQPAQPAEPPVKFTEEDFGVTADPNKFQEKLGRLLQHTVSQALGPLQVQNFMTQAEMAKMNARHSLKYYDLFGAEIENIMAQQPVNVAASPAAWQMLHDRFVQQNIGRVMEHENRRLAATSKPTPQTMERTVSPPANRESNRVQLTEEELRVARGTGIDPRQYAFYRDRY